MQNNTKDIYKNSNNNYSSEYSKLPILVSNINTNLHSNPCSQENFFNELINTANSQESKNNSSFYNCSESNHSNPDNPNIIMNKDQLYHTFILFQKFLNQNVVNNNNMNQNKISQNKVEIQNKYITNNNIYNDKNTIDEMNEINEFEDNNNENDENNDKSNGKIIFRKNKTSQNWKNREIKIDTDDINKELVESKSHYNIINGKDNINNWKNDNIIFFDEELNKEKDLLYNNDDDMFIKLNSNNKFHQNDDIKNRETINSYDDIPIKCNKVKFADLVEKKLADEKQFENMEINTLEQKNIFTNQKIKDKIENKNVNNIQFDNPINYTAKIKNNNDIDIPERERDNEKIISYNISHNNKKNIINNNISDRQEGTIMNNKKNIYANIDLNIINNRDNDSANKLLINNEIENKIKNYKFDKIQLCLISHNKDKKKDELDNDINNIDEKERLLDQKIKELNKEMVKLKEEKNKVSKIKIEYEKSMSKFNNDLYQFGQKKDEFEKYRKNELIKIKNDKKNIMSESKNIKELKNQNQALIIKSKKDKEIIDNLKSKIYELESIIKQKESNNYSSFLQGNYSCNTVKYPNKRSGINKSNNLAEIEIGRISTNHLIDEYYKNIKNNSIRSMANINNLICNTIENKPKDKNNINNMEKEKEKHNRSLSMKRNNSSYKVEISKNENKNIIINDSNLTFNNYGNTMNNNLKNFITNESKENISLSNKNLEKTQNNVSGNKDSLNERIFFSPQASRATVGFGLKRLSIKFDKSPKENVITKKIYENKNKQNKSKKFSKAITSNNLASSINSNKNNESNRTSNSNSNININNNNQKNQNNKNNKNIIKKYITRERQVKKQNITNDLYNSNKIIKKNNQKSKKIDKNAPNDKKDIFSPKTKNNVLNKSLKPKKNENDNININNNLNNSTNNSKKLRAFHNKKVSEDNFSRNKKSKKKEKNITDVDVNNIKNYLNKNKILDEYDFKIPIKYLNTDYKLIKTLKTDGKTINLYTHDKREIIFKSGVKKEIYEDGHQIIYFVNGDLKQIYPDGKSCYYFKESKTVQTTLNNGMEIYKFENGKIEKHHPDGTKQIIFNDGSERYIYNDGFEETYFSDGNVQKIDKEKNVIAEKLQDDEDE